MALVHLVHVMYYFEYYSKYYIINSNQKSKCNLKMLSPIVHRIAGMRGMYKLCVA